MKKSRIFTVIKCLFLAAFVICTIVISKNRYKISGFISLEDSETDYETFWDFIYNEYPFTEVCERKGADLKKIKEEGYKEIKSSSPRYSQNSYISFYAKLCEDITSRYFIGHLYPASIYNYQYDMTTSDSYFKLYDVDLMNSFYRVKPSYSVNSLIGSDARMVKADIKIIEEGKIAYVRIDSFRKRGYAKEYIQYKKDMKKFFLDTEKYKHIIIDIRDNGGGAYEDALLLIEPHLKENTYYKRYVLYNENKYTKPYLDFMCSRHQSIESIEKSNIPNIQNCGTIKNDKAYAITEYAALRPIMGYKPRKDKKFWLLINNGCYSASDKLASACKRIGFAVLVGENTGGAGMNGLYPMHFVLPNSGLIFFFDYVYGLNTEGYCQDEVGTVPDIYNLPGKDALETCLETIRKLESID